MQQSNESSVYQAFQASSLMYLFLDQVWWFFKLVAQCKLWLATTVAHLVKPATLKHHATKQDVIFLSSVSSVKLDVPFLDQVWWFFKLVAQCKLWLATTVAHLVKPATLKHHATKQQIICLSSVSSVKLDVPFSWPSVVVLQVGSTVQTMIGYHCAHLVKLVSTKHHATKQQIICLSSVSSVKLDVPFSWPSVVVLQVGSTVQTMIGYHCGTSCEASDFETPCNKARCHLFVKRFKRQAWCTFSWPSVVVLQVGSTVQTMIGHLCGTSCEASDFETSCSRAINHLFIKRFKRQAWCIFFLTKCGGSSSW